MTLWSRYEIDVLNPASTTLRHGVIYGGDAVRQPVVVVAGTLYEARWLTVHEAAEEDGGDSLLIAHEDDAGTWYTLVGLR
ncbi:hypothetical protein [Actinomadura flavalba]|uniref:hypothetical protein n=1 Tax=Actinomadura flavalba TaxID=1120938 RepID=UPI000526707C|nr:hypothetical protein [Actinomadura flavalba]